MPIDDPEITARHAGDCYAPFKCQSCGCQRKLTRACISHQGNPMHMADIEQAKLAKLERIAQALERHD